MRGQTDINVFDLKDGSLKELDFLLNQKVKVIDIIGEEHVGTLQFVGTSELFPSWGLYCTLSRVPGIMINGIKDIELLGN